MVERLTVEANLPGPDTPEESYIHLGEKLLEKGVKLIG